MKRKTGQLVNAKKTFGHYIFEHELGRGGMGVVYKAHDPQLRRTVAIKLVLQQSVNDFERFIRESYAMAKLDHPNIIRVYHFSRSPRPHLVMEYIEGATLADLIQQKKIKPSLLVDILIKVCDALAHAHNNSILHRDIKPSNIMIGRDGNPKLMDFGVAKMSDRDMESLSKSGDILGTVDYMAPEQLKGYPCEASDIYSIGATMYEALTYRTMYDGDSYNVFYQALHDEPPRLRELNPEISPYLEAICLKCIAKKPPQRYISSEQLADELRNFKNHRAIIAKKYSQLHRTKNFVRNDKMLYVSMFFMFVVFILLFMWQKQQKTKVDRTLQKIISTTETFIRENDPRQSEKFLGALSQVLIDTDDSRSRNFILGYAFYQKNNLQKSLEYYDLHIANDPQDVVAYYYRAMVYDKLGKYQEALDNLNKSIELQPLRAKGYFHRGDICDKLKQYPAALTDFSKSIELLPNNGEAYYRRGYVYFKMQSFQEAVNDFNMTIDLNPHHAEAHFYRGDSYLVMRQKNRAFADFNQAIKLKPNYVDAYNSRGYMYYQERNYEKARMDFDKVLKLDSGYIKAYKNRGLIFLNTKNYIKALKDFRQMVNLQPKNAEGYGFCGDTYYRMKQYHKAVNAYKEFIKLNSKVSVVHNNLGHSYFLLENYEDALKSYNNAIALPTQSSDPYFNRGILYFHMERYHLAIKDLQRGLAISPHKIRAHEYLHKCYQKTNRNAKAQYHLRKAQGK